MRVSEKWLREWVNPPVATEALAEQLTMAGLEVDSLLPAAPAFDGVVIGHVLKVDSHPDADKLRLCQVDVARDEPLVIVCGASNVRADMRVPTAMIGARLPSGLKIKKTKLRGVESFGMLCSATELGLAESSEGLMALPADAPIGADVRTYLQLDDMVIDVDLTPNRGDCLGMAGIAREVGVLNRCDVTWVDIEAVSVTIEDTLPVTVQSPQDCPRYLGRVIRGVNSAASTPIWMQERLRRGGIRSLGPLVDVTNYVLLELGQPMHAFDLSQLDDGVHVRRASTGERLTLLDGKELHVDADTLLITDANKPLALAGIMGGAHSGVSDATRDLFLECAFFMPTSIAGRARRYGLQTESSYRFERGVDPEIQEPAMQRATRLLLDIVGGQAGPITEVVSAKHLPRAEPIMFRPHRLARVLGMEIPATEVEEILIRLGMQNSRTDHGEWMVRPPTFRFDVAQEVDLIEEVGRIYGYDRLPTQRPLGRLVMRPRPEGHVPISRIQQTLVERAYQEVVTYSFIDRRDQSLFYPDARGLELANPISSELAIMRAGLWPGLLRTMVHNLNRQQSRVRIFESGLKFIFQADELNQVNVISGAIVGTSLGEQWGAASRAVDFYDMKADVQALLDLTAAGDQFIFESKRHPALHPGQSACIVRNNKNLGWVGAIHPEVQHQLGINDRVLVFELELDELSCAVVPRYEALSRYPSIRRDLAIVVNEDVSARQVCDCIRAALPDLLQEVRLFDVYRGKGIDFGRKSLALGLILQESSRTLTDQEVDAAIHRIVAQLEQELGAALRD